MLSLLALGLNKAVYKQSPSKFHHLLLTKGTVFTSALRVSQLGFAKVIIFFLRGSLDFANYSYM